MTKKELERENKILKMMIAKARNILEEDLREHSDDYVARHGQLAGRMNYYLSEEYKDHLLEMEKIRHSAEV